MMISFRRYSLDKNAALLSPVAICYACAIFPFSCDAFYFESRRVVSRMATGKNRWKRRHVNAFVRKSKIFCNSHSHRLSRNSAAITLTDVVEEHYQQHHAGDWAGTLSNFHSQTGILIPVPEYLVPQAMIEWGAIPVQLEVFSSETLDQVDNAQNLWNLQRETVTILPDVGCGCDNLETKKVTESLVFSIAAPDETNSASLTIRTSASVGKIYPDGILLVAHQKTSNPSRYEILVSVPVEKLNEYEHRTRISFEVDLNQPCEIKTPVSIIKERRISSTSSNASVADGGGLDSRTVSNLIGIEAINRPFALGCKASECLFELEDKYKVGRMTSLRLPGGVFIKYGPYTIKDNDCDTVEGMLVAVSVSISQTEQIDVPSKQCYIRSVFGANLMQK